MRPLPPAFRFVVLLVTLLAGSAFAQTTGEVQQLSLVGGSASITLDFTQQDYELILYSAVTDPADTSSAYSFTVSGPNVAAKPIVLKAPSSGPATDRERLEEVLRARERDLARRIREAGWKPSATRPQPLQAQNRSFVFEEFGNVTSDQTVNAALVASNNVVLAYLDDDPQSQGVFTVAQIQEMIDTFQNESYETITDLFGEASDVDGDGKILFLFTHLVDQVGGVAGFFGSSSVVPSNLGGDGNLSDMMYIGLDGSLDFYKPLLAHEFQHLVNYNEHALVRNGSGEDSWLNEGLSHYAEDLVGSHVEGDLPRLYTPFLESPQTFSLIGPAGANNGIRGAAYLFVRTLVKDFSPTIVSQLVQTDLAGTENVESATNFTFVELFNDHVARLFLSGTGLNDSRIYNYTFSFFTEAGTGKRSLPNPREVGVPAAGAPVTGTLHPLSAGYLRLMGDAASQTISIDSDPAGELNALLIPIPRDYHPDRALRGDYFPALTFDTAVPGLFTTAVPVEFTGQVADSDITQLLFQFVSTDGAGREIEFFTTLIQSGFSEFIIFQEDQAGSYDLEIYGGPFNESLPFVGRFPVEVLQGTQTVRLPEGFFQGITLDDEFETSIAAGAPIPFAGMVVDPSVSEVQLQLDALGQNEDLIIRTDVRSNRFSRGFVFEPGSEGDYAATLFTFDSLGNATSLGNYEPITVTGATTDWTELPTDFFEDILLDKPLSTTFFAGGDVQVSGQLLDPGLNRVGLFLIDKFGTSVLDERVTTDTGQFTIELTAPILNPDDGFEIVMIAGVDGETLFGKGSYGSARLLNPQPALQLLTETLTFAETAVGETFDQTLGVDNIGTEPLTLSNFSTTGPFSSPGGSITIQPGERGSIVITFQPVSPGDTTGTFRFDSNDPDRQSALVNFAATATGQPLPTMSVQEQAVAWGQVTIGESGTRVVHIANTGDGDLLVNEISVGHADFSVGATSATIAPGDTALVSLVFEPRSEDAVVTSLTIVGNDPVNASASVVLSGIGIRPATPVIDVEGDVLSFGSVTVGLEETRGLVISNIGSSTLEISAIALTGDYRTALSTLTIAAGDSILLPIVFAPSETGGAEGTLTLTSNDGEMPNLEIALAGTGIQTQTSLSPDFNADGVVDFQDFLAFAQVFGGREGDGKYSARFDLTQDGSVGFSDFLEFAAAFGTRVDQP